MAMFFQQITVFSLVFDLFDGILTTVNLKLAGFCHSNAEVARHF